MSLEKNAQQIARYLETRLLERVSVTALYLDKSVVTIRFNLGEMFKLTLQKSNDSTTLTLNSVDIDAISDEVYNRQWRFGEYSGLTLNALVEWIKEEKVTLDNAYKKMTARSN